ncbi:patatin-like phospholipase family protein [Paenarthrobacter sp. NPDC089675]|uniref:patatin-like phospholipase family protein n=1 Tax=Paenarthrobacter sp. NPDC089675 TaxID=3364376 RepID=UPI00381B6B59
MNTTLFHNKRALVLGGGGSTGNAWLIGVVAGLFEAGVDVTTADLIIGTSAGSTAAAQITGASLAELYEATLTAPEQAGQNRPVQSRADQARAGQGRPGSSGAGGVSTHMERTARIIADSTDAADMRRKMGASALQLQAELDQSTQERWRATVASRLPRPEWPAQSIIITAVNARTGEPVDFNRESGVTLADAVAASCSSGFAYTIGSHAYVDGGYRTNAENADLAAGYGRVLVLSPFGGRTRTPAAWGLDLDTQVRDLRDGGSRVETIFPDSASEHMFGTNAMNFSLRPAAARAGHQLGRSLGEKLGDMWNGQAG